MPHETTSAEAAYGIGNLAFYRMCEEFPLHVDDNNVSDKIVFISRVYSVARGLGEWGTLSNNIVKSSNDLDRQIEFARQQPFLENIDAVIQCHAFLDNLVCRSLKGSGKVAHGRASFVSKYLHFHAPDAFPILDTLACRGLKELTPKFRTSLKVPTPYARFCERLAHYLKDNRIQGLSLRHIDTDLVKRGRKKSPQEASRRGVGSAPADAGPLSKLR